MITKRDLAYFKKADEIASMSDFKGVQIGCIIVRKNKTIGFGFNRNKSHTKQMRKNVLRTELPHGSLRHYLHAEMMALIPLQFYDLTGCKIYISRKNKHNEFQMCRPCKACMDAILKAGIKKIYYTRCDGFVYEEVGKLSAP